jgi:hypothetical protein
MNTYKKQGEGGGGPLIHYPLLPFLTRMIAYEPR